MGYLKNRFTSAPEKDAGGAPSEGASRCFYLLKTHFWKLLGVNLLMLAFSCFIVTIPAAKCGMNRVLIKLVRDGNCFVWQEFRDEFKTELFKSLPLGILFAALLGFSYYALSLGLSNSQTPMGIVFGAVGFFALIVECALSGYCFVLLPMLDLKGADIMRNARALIFRGAGKAAAVVGIKLAALALQLLLFPIGLALMIILPAVCELSLCSIVNPLAQKYIIAPYEKRKSER